MERRKLFSENKERRKLFSTPALKERIKMFSETAEEEAFQRVFSATTDPYELKLKEYSGQTLHATDFASIFGDTLDERYYTANDEGDVTISPSAFIESRLFSKIIMSVTKTLELDPAAINEPKEEIINGLKDRFPAKIIALLKKAHNIPAEHDNEEYLTDSGILSDLPGEFKGRVLGRPEFIKIINERYSDAPDDIVEILKNKGIIKVGGDNVEIL